MEPLTSDHSKERSLVQKILQNEGVGKMAMLGAELALTCFLPSELVRSCFNMYSGNKKTVQEPKSEHETIEKTLELLDIRPEVRELIYEQETNHNTKSLELLDLPPEVRELIYDRVVHKDIKNLRQVCRQILEEIDGMVGVNGILNEEYPGNLEWIRSVKLRSLRVVNFRTLITDASVLNIPGAMKKLLALLPTLNPLNLKALLHGTKSVRELKLDCSKDWKMNRLTPILIQYFMAINQEFSNVILEAFRENYDLLDLNIFLPPDSVECSPNLLELERIGYKPKEYSDQDIPGWKDYSRTLKSIKIMAPVMSMESCDQWKILFDLQNRLECFCCNMGIVHWSLYSKMLKNCNRTLKVIALCDVQSFDREFLFDWSILSQCPCLEVLNIIATNMEPHDGLHGHAHFFESVNFFSVNMENLRELTLMFVHLDESGFKKIFNNAPKLIIANLFFVRRERNSYKITSILTKALKKNSNIQMVHIADEDLETPDHEFRNEMGLLTDYKCLFRVYDISNGSSSVSMSMPMIHITRLPIAEIWFKNKFKWSKYVNFQFDTS